MIFLGFLFPFSIFWDRTQLYLISMLFHVLSLSVVQYCRLSSDEAAYCRLSGKVVYLKGEVSVSATYTNRHSGIKRGVWTKCGLPSAVPVFFYRQVVTNILLDTNINENKTSRMHVLR